jgi:hypothetical protein
LYPASTISKYELKKLAIGTINFCFIVTTPHSKVVARISRDANEANSLSDRSKERKLLGVITERGLGVKLLGVFENGMQTLSAVFNQQDTLPSTWKENI